MRDTCHANKNKTSEAITGVMSPYGFNSAAGQQPAAYDADDRLVGWNRNDGNKDQAWALTPVGDWDLFTEEAVTQDRSHGPAHEITGVTIGANTNPVQHDVKGNVTFIPAILRGAAISDDMTLSWDFDNRLASADTDNGGTADVTFGYDALGRRVRKTTATVDTVFVQAGQQVIADYTAGAAATSPREKYVYASYIDEPILKDGTLASGAGIVYYHRNQQYSVTALTDASGSAIERYAYSPYGWLTILDGSGSAIASAQTANRYTYTGREHDPETNLYHFRARYYSPTLGRFLNRDPLGYVDGMSLYRGYFVLSGVDPGGEQTRTPAEVEAACIRRCKKHKFFFQASSPTYKWCYNQCKNSIVDDPVGGTGDNSLKGKCKLQVCCRRVGINFGAHCVIRFIGDLGGRWVEGCRGGPSGRGDSDTSTNNQSSHCSGCCGPWGNIVTACGAGKVGDSDPAEHGLGVDLQTSIDNPFRCTTVNTTSARCFAIKKCVYNEMARIENACYRYAPLANNSNATWRTALNNCLNGNESLPDPWGFQPGNQYLKENLGHATCK